MNQYVARIAGIELNYALRFPECANYLKKVLIGSSDRNPSECIQVEESEFQAWQRAGNTIDGFAEFCLSCMPTSEALMNHDRCIFHAAAVRYQDRAWLIAAGSGVGKTTQCKTLIELCPEEITVINGDKPVLECCLDGQVIVHPSPWTGKEGLYGAEAAPLEGIVLLTRGEENSIVPAKPQMAAMCIYKAIFQTYANEELIQKVASIAEKIMKSASVWLMTSHEVPESTKLLLEVMKQETNQNGI